jgi:hypothetical protein
LKILHFCCLGNAIISQLIARVFDKITRKSGNHLF